MEAADVAQALSQAGHLVEILTIHWEGSWPISFQFREVDVHRFNRRLGGPWGMFRYLRDLNRHINQSRFDALIIYGLADDSWAALRNYAHSMPVGLRIDQADWNAFVTRRFHFRQRRILNQLTRVWVDDAQTRDALIHYNVDPDSIEIIPPCIQLPANFEYSSRQRSTLRASLSDAHPILDLEPHLPFAVCGSPLNDEGIEILLLSWKLVLRQLSRARLWILGDGNLQQDVWNRVSDLQLAHSIVLPGQFDQLEELLIAADLYVHPSIFSLSCHRLARAMAAGTCVVAVESDFTSRWLTQAQNGILVPPRNPQALADALINAFQNLELRNRLGSAAQASQRFQVENWLDRFLKLKADS
jgi:glycosyltransferase involved in cell wall biosynthesis